MKRSISIRRALANSLAIALCCCASIAAVANADEPTRVVVINPAETYGFPEKPENWRADWSPVVTGVALSPDKKTIYVGGDDQRLYSCPVGQPPFKLVMPLGPEPRNDYGRTKNNGDIDPAKKSELAPLTVKQTSKESQDWIRSISFLPDRALSPDNPAYAEGKLNANDFAALAQNGKLTIWNLATKQVARERDVVVQGAHSFAYSPNGLVVAVCGFSPDVNLFDALTLNPITTWRAPGESSTTIEFSRQGEYLAVGGRNGIARVWTTVDGNPYHDFTLTDAKPGTPRRVRAVAFSPDDSILAVAGDANRIMLWNLKTFEPVMSFDTPSGKTFALAFCGPNLLASGDSRNVLHIWDLTTGEEVVEGKGHLGTITTILFAEYSAQNGDGTFTNVRSIFTGSFDTKVIRWEIPDDVYNAANPEK